MPENALERADLQREFSPSDGVIPRMTVGWLIKFARPPDIDWGTANCAGNEADGHAGIRLRDREAKRAPRPDTDRRGFVEVHRIDGRHPLARLIQHEHA